MLEFLRSWQRERGRVIIFSGVFDPVHNGHISVARKALEQEGGLVVFLPERSPHRTSVEKGTMRHKTSCMPFADRVHMLKLATEHEPRFIVLESPFEHHTIKKTLSWVKDKFPAGQNFGLLFGSDVAAHFWFWPDVASLSEYGVDKVIFADRTGDNKQEVSEHQKYILSVQVTTLQADNGDLSSTQIRQNLDPHKQVIPEAVYRYIKEKHLYSEGSSAKK